MERRFPKPPSLWVHSEVVSSLVRLPKRPWEVGGWLLGFWTADRRSVFVTHGTPSAGCGTPFGVKISGRGHRGGFDEAWAASDGHVTFLGDWHTHPGCPAVPSDRDLTALCQLAQDRDFGTPQPLAAIVETGRWPFGATPSSVRWYFLHSDDEPLELSPRITETLPEAARGVPHWRWRERRR